MSIPQGAFAALQVRKNLENSYVTQFNSESDKKDNKNTGFYDQHLQEGKILSTNFQ